LDYIIVFSYKYINIILICIIIDLILETKKRI